MIICITGLPGSGKSTFAEALRSKGFQIFEISTTIKDEMTAKKMEISPKSVEDYANTMKEKHGKDVFAKATAKNIMVHRGDAAIIGVRSIPELQAMNEVLGLSIPLVLITAPEDLRFQRLSERSELPIKSRDIFMMRENSNKHMGIFELFEHAEFIVSNVGSMEELEEDVSDILGVIRPSQQKRIK